jgi:hypothetical protein
VGGDRALEARAGVLDGLVPRGAAELGRALRAVADQRMQQPLVRVHAVEVVGDLAAEKAVRDRVLRVAADLDGPPVLVDRDQHRAGVGAVVGTGRVNDPDRSVRHLLIMSSAA